MARLPKAFNEPVKTFLPESPERLMLETELKRQMSMVAEIPLIINGKDMKTSESRSLACPHDHGHDLAMVYQASPEEIRFAIQSALAAKTSWEALPWQERACIFLKAAELISEKYSHVLNAATMLGQSKNAFQAQIDATCELVDFLRFNVQYMEEIYSNQPSSEKGVWNRIEYRPLEGFIFALSPFNFTAIGANLCAGPALMGNTVVWKPSFAACLSGYYLMQIFKEAGLPDGVINFIPAEGSVAGEIVLNHKDLGGIHFTGSTKVFQTLWKKTAQNIANYRSYPRLVGETGGKDFIFVHPSASSVDQVVTAAIRGAFEYQGQKCSAASRMYVPESLWPEIRTQITAGIKRIRMGDVLDFKNFMNAVIDRQAFEKSKGFIQRAEKSSSARIIAGGKTDDSKGYFIEPTIILTQDPFYESMTEEIFGPVLTIYVYEDRQIEKMLEIVDSSSIYALTGAIFASDRTAINYMTEKLTHSAGNFYINDKPSGAVVGRQPFGGARASGTNDKAGSFLNLVRWTSVRTIKENFVPPEEFEYEMNLIPSKDS